MNHGYPPAAQRGTGPPGPGPQGPSQRLNELLDQIRSEFDTESSRSVEYENQSKFWLFARLCAFSTVPTSKLIAHVNSHQTHPGD